MSSKAFSSTSNLFLSLTKTILFFFLITLLVAGDGGGDGQPTPNPTPPVAQPSPLPPSPPPQIRYGTCNCTLDYAKAKLALSACILVVGGEIVGPQTQTCCDGVEGLINEGNRCFCQNVFSNESSNNNNGGANDQPPPGTHIIDLAHNKILSACGIHSKININCTSS